MYRVKKISMIVDTASYLLDVHTLTYNNDLALCLGFKHYCCYLVGYQQNFVLR